MPRFGRLCRPCDNASDCRIPNVPSESSRCIPRGTEGSFCGATCSDSDACPPGYFCDIVDVGNGPIKQCVRDGDEICDCKPEWAGKGYSTTCSESNGFGTCDGSRDCDAGTLSDCTATVPAAEVCDGEDNDCNDLADDGNLCNDSLLCTSDSCDGANGCQNDVNGGFCSINLACYANNDANPSNACQLCKASTNDTEWTVIDNSCAIAGSCYDSGATKSPLASCEVCDPDRDTKGWSLANNSCLIGSTCYQDNDSRSLGQWCEKCDSSSALTSWSLAANSCLINGSCYSPNDNRGGNAWCEVCAPGVTTSAWTQQANTCVINGACYGSGAANPANPCQVCNPASSTTSWTAQASSCSIGGQCYGAGATQPGQACNTCDPARSTTAWSLANNTCKIGGNCYADGETKDAGAWCQECDPGQSASAWSLTLNACIIGGQCYSAGATQSGNVCHICSAATPTLWSGNTGASCSDGLSCTTPDVCQADGTCEGGSSDTDDVPPGTDFHTTRIGACNTWPSDNTVRGITGVLIDGNDPDWFMARGDPGSILGAACDIDPLWTLNTNGVAVRACMFFSCRSGGTASVTCKEGSSAATDPAVPGYSGCCETGPNPTLQADVGSCVDDKTNIRFRIDNGATASCTSYSFDFHN